MQSFAKQTVTALMSRNAALMAVDISAWNPTQVSQWSVVVLQLLVQ